MVNKYYQTEDFLPKYNSLQKHTKRAVMDSLNDFAMKCENNIALMDCKKLNSDYNLYRLKANKGVRIILHKDKKTSSYVFLWVDKHDEAYDWARKCNYVFDEEYLTDFKFKWLDYKDEPKKDKEKIKIDYNYPKYNLPQYIPPKEKESLFEHLNSETLRDFGIPEELIDHVRSIKTLLDFGKLRKMVSNASYLLLRNYLIISNRALKNQMI